MAVKKGNKYIQITLTPYHDKKTAYDVQVDRVV